MAVFSDGNVLPSFFCSVHPAEMEAERARSTRYAPILFIPRSKPLMIMRFKILLPHSFFLVTPVRGEFRRGTNRQNLSRISSVSVSCLLNHQARKVLD